MRAMIDLSRSRKEDGRYFVYIYMLGGSYKPEQVAQTAAKQPSPSTTKNQEGTSKGPEIRPVLAVDKNRTIFFATQAFI